MIRAQRSIVCPAGDKTHGCVGTMANDSGRQTWVSKSGTIKCRLLIFNVPSQIIIDYDVLTAALEFPNIGSCLWIKIRKGVGALS